MHDAFWLSQLLINWFMGSNLSMLPSMDGATRVYSNLIFLVFFDVPEVANDGKKFAAIFILAHDIFYPSVCRRIKHLNWHIPKSLLLFTHSEQTSECKCIHRQGHHGEGLLHRRRLRRRPVHGRPRAPSARPSTSPGSASMPGSEQRRHGSRRRTRSSWRSPLSSS